MFLKKGFKYRLEPTNAQQELFAQFAGSARFLYNRGLEQRKTAYEKEEKTITYYDQNNELVALKKDEKTSWLSNIHSQVLQQALQNLVLCLKNYYSTFGVKAAQIDDRKLMRIELIRNNLRSLRSSISASFHARNCSNNF